MTDFVLDYKGMVWLTAGTSMKLKLRHASRLLFVAIDTSVKPVEYPVIGMGRLPHKYPI